MAVILSSSGAYNISAISLQAFSEPFLKTVADLFELDCADVEQFLDIRQNLLDNGRESYVVHILCL